VPCATIHPRRSSPARLTSEGRRALHAGRRFSRNVAQGAHGSGDASRAGARFERAFESSHEHGKTARGNERLILAQCAGRVFESGHRVDLGLRRVASRSLDDARAGGFPRRAVTFGHPPQIDLRLHDEDRAHVLADQPEKRRVAFGERLLRIDKVEHRVRARQIGKRCAPVCRIE
jgi:hypothetical protein